MTVHCVPKRKYHMVLHSNLHLPFKNESSDIGDASSTEVRYHRPVDCSQELVDSCGCVLLICAKTECVRETAGMPNGEGFSIFNEGILCHSGWQSNSFAKQLHASQHKETKLHSS